MKNRNRALSVMLCKSLLKFIIILIAMNGVVVAMDDAMELAKKSQNPVEKMVTIPFNNNFNYGYGPDNTTQYILDIKPVIPFSLSESWNLITRTIIPVNSQQNLLGKGYITQVSDINSTFFISPAHPGKILWGAGPVIFLPTGSNVQIGQGKYSIGPSVVVLTMPGSWVIGTLINNAWSIAGDKDRPSVNQMSFQYFINYNFPHGWYITSSPTMTADWTAPSNNRYTIPIGVGVGRVFEIGKQSVNVSIQAYDNIVTPKTLGPNWQLELNISFLFPET